MKTMELTVFVEENKVRVVMEDRVDLIAPWLLLFLSRYIKNAGKRGMARICARAIANDKEEEVMDVLLEAFRCRDGGEVKCGRS